MVNKLIIAIINKEDSKKLCQALTKAKHYVTQLHTQGGFLMSGNETLLIGTEAEKIPEIVKIIETYSQTRTEIVPVGIGYPDGPMPIPIEVTVGGATIFVLDVEQFIKV